MQLRCCRSEGYGRKYRRGAVNLLNVQTVAWCRKEGGTGEVQGRCRRGARRAVGEVQGVCRRDAGMVP